MSVINLSSIQVDSSELVRSQNFIPKCDFWFSATSNHRSLFQNSIPVLQRSDTTFDYINPFDANRLTEKSIVFCKFDYLPQLIQHIESSKVRTPFVLMTGQSDYEITDELVEKVQSRISVRWCGCNCSTKKAIPIPRGIADDFCIITMQKNFSQTTGEKLLYVNHRVETYPSVREPLYKLFCNQKWATVSEPKPKGVVDEFTQELKQHKFMLCPRGNGIETHRMWEALYCGAIPIVIKHPTHRLVEGRLPVLFVEDYQEVNENLLETVWETFKHKTWDYSMMKCSWWINYLKNSNQ